MVFSRMFEPEIRGVQNIFEKNQNRYKGLKWTKTQDNLGGGLKNAYIRINMNVENIKTLIREQVGIQIEQIVLEGKSGLGSDFPRTSDEAEGLLEIAWSDIDKEGGRVIIGFNGGKQINTLEIYSKMDFPTLSELICAKMKENEHFEFFDGEEECATTLKQWEVEWGFKYAFVHPRSVSIKVSTIPSATAALLDDIRRLSPETFETIDEDQYVKHFLKDRHSIELYWS